MIEKILMNLKQSILRDSARLISVSVFQKILATFSGLLYLSVLSPAAYAAWKSLSTFFQIGIPGWSYLQTDFARRRAEGNALWSGAWKAMIIVSFTFGVLAVSIAWAMSSWILAAYSTARPYATLLTVGSLLFVTNPLKTTFNVWWQVTGRFRTYTTLQAIEQTLYVGLLLIGFVVFRGGVAVIPISLVTSQTFVIFCSAALWYFHPEARQTTESATSGFRYLSGLIRAEGKWVIIRESFWDWVEAIKIALLNQLFSATTLGFVFAAETLAGYVTSLISSLQPLLQVRLGELLDPKALRAAYQRGVRLLVTASWIVYVASLPVVIYLIPLLFPKYADAVPFYWLIALQMPWAAVSLMLMPYLYTLPSQRRLFSITCERNALEIILILAGAVLMGGSPYAIIAAHLVSGYWYTYRRQALLERLTHARVEYWSAFLPYWSAVTDVSKFLRTWTRRSM